MPEQDPSIMVKCECSAEALEVTYWSDMHPDDFLFAFWQQGFNRPMCWRERIRWCWNVIKTGNPWADSIIVTNENALKIAEFIKAHAKKANKNGEEDGRGGSCCCSSGDSGN